MFFVTTAATTAKLMPTIRCAYWHKEGNLADKQRYVFLFVLCHHFYKKR